MTWMMALQAGMSAVVTCSGGKFCMICMKTSPWNMLCMSSHVCRGAARGDDHKLRVGLGVVQQAEDRGLLEDEALTLQERGDLLGRLLRPTAKLREFLHANPVPTWP